MKFLVTLSWLTLSVILAAAPKYAVVRVTDIYRDLPSTEAIQKQIQGQREAIISSKRAEQLRMILTELQSIEAQLKENKDKIDSESGRKLVRDYEIKRQEAGMLQQEFEEFRSEEGKRINKEMVTGMRASLARITGATQQIAKERNLDGVFDVSGSSNTGVPFVLYVGDAPDLTEDVIELLDEKPLVDTADSAPAEAEEKKEEDN